ncbi:MAG: chalcone isomerase family protein [Desulfobacterales bacterium]|nr:chalcone isomerase family protein [Desulfobacterales bacterium]MDX2512957.1 chalcone isomerase family protein [Desulfobacterales bacterium]
MMKRILVLVTMLVFAVGTWSVGFAGDMEILGVTFPGEKVVEGKTLKLNGVAYRKALGIVKVYVVGLYLENPTTEAEEVINSEQVKHLLTHYLTSKATVKKLQEGFLEVIEKCNPPEMVTKHRSDIDEYASWLDKDMAPGLTSFSTYVPGKGLTMTYQGEVKGTIPGDEFMKMYYRYNVGEKAQKRIRKGLLGL